MSHRHLARRGKGAAFLIALAAVFTLILSACASSSTSSGSLATASGGGSDKAAGGESDTPSASSASTTDPVVVGVMYTDNNPLGTSPEIKSTALAAHALDRTSSRVP